MTITNFKINGNPYAVNLSTLPADITLNTFIREHAQLTATKNMCLEGGCGVCVCVIKGKHPATGEMKTWAANSCLTLLNTCTDWEIITSEGIGSNNKGYHPIQKRLAKMNGSQCGYCSPGMVMNMYALWESKQGKLSMEEIENSFGGNICRCTGYRPILDAMKSFAVNSNITVPAECAGDIEDLAKKTCPKTGQKCAGSCGAFNLTKLVYDDDSTWHWPKTISDVFVALKQIGNSPYILVAGNTAHGVYRRSTEIKHFIDLKAIPELKTHSFENDQLLLGGNLSLTEAMDIFKEAAKKPGYGYCEQLWNHFDLIANVPVRNTGTLAGNISIKRQHPEFPSDVFLVFEALNVNVVVRENAETQKTLQINDFVQSSDNKLLVEAFILKPYHSDKYVFNSYKIMPRAQNAHAYVNAAFLLNLDKSTGETKFARICFGGIKPNYVHAANVESILSDRNLFAKDTVESIFIQLDKDLEPDQVLPDASPEYRKNLACALMYKFLLHVAGDDKVRKDYISGAEILKRPLSSGIQTFQTQKKNYPVTQPVTKVEATTQCSGEATYMNDVLTTSNAAFCAFVGATKVGATIEEIDASEALKYPGVLAFYSAKDIPGANTFVDPSLDFENEEIFCSSTVAYHEQPVGVVVALTQDIAHRAAAKVKIMYSSVINHPLHFTMNDVIAANIPERIKTLIKAEVSEIELSDKPDITATGIFEMGLQYHYTMEPMTCVVVPFEQGLEVWSTTQWMDLTQIVVAKMLQIKLKDVQLKVRRLGGGYGSKISRVNLVTCAAALAAYKLNRPIRFVQTIESMMNSNGKRWACRSDYEFHIKSNGKIVGLNHTFYEDAGHTFNESPVEHMSTVCTKNVYSFTDKNLKLEGKAVKTDAPSNTWCRAPGSVEGVAMGENIIEHIAFEANADPADVRLLNIAPGHKLATMLPDFLTKTEYRARKKEIQEFNEKNRWRKRGLGLAIMEYPVGYFAQYPATLAVYHGDGTVVITHGGIEMGQGMNTKVVQVAAYHLGIPMEYIRVEASDTVTGANSMVTGGSIGSEGVCWAVRKCCETLKARLKPVRDALNKDATWEDVVQAAWGKSINLIVNELHKVGDMEAYKVHGLGLTEVEVDILTGNLLIKRVDILEDAGESLSPHVDIGQMEGAFVMVLGYWLTEQLIYDRSSGQLLTNRTWTYKPPGAKDIPIDFRIELLKNSANTGGFMRSKATGEPPCCLAISSIFAVQEALQSARKDAGLKREWVRLGAPTTPETIVLNAGTNLKSFTLS